MNNQELKNKLLREGFAYVYEWHDEPGTIYPEHAHKGRVSFYITRGSVTFSGGINQVIQAGARVDVPPGTKHSAVVGRDGCDYIIGEEVKGDS